eukprot:m.118501 g.118501  ORF g.118501 m.118501 type:complete len:357 (+) comp14279_c0_seq1:401-1471(+)
MLFLRKENEGHLEGILFTSIQNLQKRRQVCNSFRFLGTEFFKFDVSSGSNQWPKHAQKRPMDFHRDESKRHRKATSYGHGDGPDQRIDPRIALRKAEDALLDGRLPSRKRAELEDLVMELRRKIAAEKKDSRKHDDKYSRYDRNRRGRHGHSRENPNHSHHSQDYQHNSPRDYDYGYNRERQHGYDDYDHDRNREPIDPRQPVDPRRAIDPRQPRQAVDPRQIDPRHDPRQIDPRHDPRQAADPRQPLDPHNYPQQQWNDGASQYPTQQMNHPHVSQGDNFHNYDAQDRRPQLPLRSPSTAKLEDLFAQVQSAGLLPLVAEKKLGFSPDDLKQKHPKLISALYNDRSVLVVFNFHN